MTVTAATVKEREDEGGGFSQRRQGQLLRHDEVYPIRSPGLLLLSSINF